MSYLYLLLKKRFVYLFILLCLVGVFLNTLYSVDSYQDKEVYDVAIIGGGVSGCYCGWRLVQDDARKDDKKQISVHLFEMSDRIGGRLYTVFLPGMPHIPVELGGMRFRSSNFLVFHLAEYLKLPYSGFTEEISDNFLFLRGKRFRSSESTNARILPYELTPHEEGKTPYQLIRFALQQLVPNFDTLSLHDWEAIKETVQFKGVTLDKVSWQNFLGATLSSEAYQYLVDSGAIQEVNNISLASQIPNYVKTPPFKTLKFIKGYQDLPKTLSKDFEKKGGKIHQNYRLTSIQKVDDPNLKDLLRLVFENTKEEEDLVEVYAHKVILAMPKRAIELLDEDSFIFDQKDFMKNLDSVNANPLTKLFLGYSEAWWRKLSLYSGDSISDFGLRDTFYFGTEEEAPGGDAGNTNALLLASYQGARMPFWKAFAPGDPYAGEKNPHIPVGESALNKKVAISKFAITQTQRMLKALHGVDIPSPYTAAYIDWSKDPYGGAYYNWKIGANPEKIIKAMRKPISDANLYICGCTYSDMQGWVEGALKTAELVLEENFDLKKPSWLPGDYNLGP